MRTTIDTITAGQTFTVGISTYTAQKDAQTVEAPSMVHAGGWAPRVKVHTTNTSPITPNGYILDLPAGTMVTLQGAA